MTQHLCCCCCCIFGHLRQKAIDLPLLSWGLSAGNPHNCVHDTNDMGWQVDAMQSILHKDKASMDPLLDPHLIMAVTWLAGV